MFVFMIVFKQKVINPNLRSCLGCILYSRNYGAIFNEPYNNVRTNGPTGKDIKLKAKKVWGSIPKAPVSLDKL